MEVKKYNSVATKKQIIESIVNNSLVERDGLKFIDFVAFEMCLDLSLLNFYTDLDINNIDYDEMCESGNLESIKNQIPFAEIQFISDNAHRALEQECEIHNSIGGVLNRGLNKLLDRLPTEEGMKDVIAKLPQIINDADPSKLKFVAEAIGWNNGVKPNRAQRRAKAKAGE